MKSSAASCAVAVGGLALVAFMIYRSAKEQKKVKKKCITVRAAPFDEEVKVHVLARLLDGPNDFLKWAWDMFAKGEGWTLFRADLEDGNPVGIFLAKDQGRDEAFLNGLRTDPTARRHGVGTAIIRGIDKALAAKGFKFIRMATTSANDPMKALCARKLGLTFVPYRMCQCNAREAKAMATAIKLPPEVADDESSIGKLHAFIQASDYYACSQGTHMDGPGQFRSLDRHTLVDAVRGGQAYLLGSCDAIGALAFVLQPSPFGPNAMVRFIAGPRVATLMDELRYLIPADHPKGPQAAEIFGYLPVGCAAYELSAAKVPLGAAKEAWYCPRETLELVMEWKAGTLPMED